MQSLQVRQEAQVVHMKQVMKLFYQVQERKAESRQAKQVKEAVHQQERRVQIHLQVQVMSYLNA